MNKYIALLRGINVGGKNTIRMADLTTMFADAGFSNIITYIQSGNIVFESQPETETRLSEIIGGRISSRFGLTVPVLVRSLERLQHIADQLPFQASDGFDHKHLYITLLAGMPEPATLNRLNAEDFHPDRFHIVEDAVYLYCPSGYGKTRLNNTFWEKKTGLTATTRNLQTIQKLCTL